MSISAPVTSIWKKQKLFVSILLVGFGAYFFVDGAIVWPRSNERFLKHQEFSESGKLEEWPAYAASRGWTNKPPEKLHTDADLKGQFIFGWLCTGLGVFALGYWWRQVGRKIELVEGAVIAPDGTRIPFDAIVGLGLKRWEDKGLAKVRYQLDTRTREFVIDDYKYEMEPCKAIVAEIRRQLESRPVGDAPADRS